jgi:hypothetical protein
MFVTGPSLEHPLLALPSIGSERDEAPRLTAQPG